MAPYDQTRYVVVLRRQARCHFVVLGHIVAPELPAQASEATTQCCLFATDRGRPALARATDASAQVPAGARVLKMPRLVSVRAIHRVATVMSGAETS
jgi:hypothetical protein|eukprot:COSAG01_NODE_2296_length_7966_cov_270.955765_10_plen_97_part_00